MVKNIEDVQKFGKDNVDTVMKSMGATSRGMQAIVEEMATYSKTSFEQGTQMLEKLLGTKSVEKAIELQTDYMKSAYEGFVSEATKIGALYADLAKEMYKPYEGFIAKATVASK